MTRALPSSWLLLLVAGLVGCERPERTFQRVEGRYDHKHMVGEGFRLTAAAFSPDNKHLLAGYHVSRGTYKITQKINFDDLVLWDLQTRKPIRSWTGHKGEHEVVNAAYLPDGKRAITASYRGTLAVWEMPSGKKLWSTEDGTSILSLSADGKWLLVNVADPDGPLLTLWDLTTYRKHNDWRIDPAEGGRVPSLAISPSGKVALLGCNRSSNGKPALRVMNLETGEVVRSLDAEEEGWGPAGAFLPDGRHAVSPRWDKTKGDLTRAETGLYLVLWDTTTGKVVRHLEGDGMEPVYVSADGKRAVARSSRGGRFASWDLQTGKQLSKMELKGEGEGRFDVFACSPDTSLAFAQLVERPVGGIWDTATGALVFRLPEENSWRYGPMVEP